MGCVQCVSIGLDLFSCFWEGIRGCDLRLSRGMLLLVVCLRCKSMLELHVLKAVEF